MVEKDIEDKHWEGVKDTTGMTKEQFEVLIGLEEEIEEFLGDLDNYMTASSKVRSRFNFDPTLFLLWRMSKK